MGVRCGSVSFSDTVSHDDTNTETALHTPVAASPTTTIAKRCYPQLPPDLCELNEPDPYHGYWVHMTEAETLIYPLTGTCVE